MSSAWLRRLVHVGLSQQTLQGLGSLTEVIAQAADMSGVVLWEEVRQHETPRLTVFAAWTADRPYGHASFTPEPDALTLMAQRGRTLALPSGSAIYHLMTSNAARMKVAAALPVDWADQSRGVMTLLGDGQLTDGAFDVLTELIDVLPNLCGVVRERHALALVTTCNSILHEADVESATEPLSEDRLSAFLSQICQVIADGLQLLNVSLFLQQPTEPRDTYRLFAHSRPADMANGSVPQHASGASNGDDALMVVKLASGKRVLGRIECAGSYGPPFHFTDSDRALLAPLAAQISQYWSHWLHRRETLSENHSWRSLASGITNLNKQIHDELGQRRPADDSVYDAAFQVIRDVVPGYCGADIRSAGHGVAGDVISSSYGRRTVSDAGSAIAAVALSADRQQHGRNAQEEPDESLTEMGKEWWFVRRPIRVNNTVYGFLGATGEQGLLPSNSGQVCDVIADQLGLYHHLRRTLGDLRKAQQKVQQTLRGQADTMADIEHQLVSPLLAATVRTEQVLKSGRFDSRTELRLRAVRGLCRRASKVALSAGVFSTLSRGESLSPRLELLSSDELLRLVITNADDAQLLTEPHREIRIDVDRPSVRALGRQLLLADISFLGQCVGNLLDNATKYSYSSTTIEVKGVLANDSFILQVCSTGLLLEPGDIELCTQKNWRGSAARAATGEGSGLGLWIADNLIRSTQGRLEISAHDELTIVGLRIPYAPRNRE
jgi:signal transduction histidine kinase